MTTLRAPFRPMSSGTPSSIGKFTPISPGAATNGGTDFDYGQSGSNNGSIIAYTDADPVNGYEAVIYSAATNHTTVIGPAEEMVVTPQGNAIALVEPNAAGTAPVIYEVSLGVSAGIAPIDGNDTIDAIDMTQARTNGLAVSGTTNAPAGSAFRSAPPRGGRLGSVSVADVLDVFRSAPPRGGRPRCP